MLLSATYRPGRNRFQILQLLYWWNGMKDMEDFQKKSYRQNHNFAVWKEVTEHIDLKCPNANENYFQSSLIKKDMSLTSLNWLQSGTQRKIQIHFQKIILPNQINLFGGNALRHMNGKLRSTVEQLEETAHIVREKGRLKLIICNLISLTLQQSGIRTIRLHQKNLHLSRIRKHFGSVNAVTNGQRRSRIEPF